MKPALFCGADIMHNAAITYDCIRVPDGSINVDGFLDDDIWSKCAPIDLVISDSGLIPSRRTTVKACWSSERLYISFDCQDCDVWGTMYGHDEPLYDEEVVEAFLNPSGDLVDYYEFEMNPNGACFDAFVHNPSGTRESMIVDISWDCEGWLYAVNVEGEINSRKMADERWTVEWSIPFSSVCEGVNLPRNGTLWRANFYRIDLTPFPEFSSWCPTMKSPPDFHVPSAFGTIIFRE